LDGNGHNPTVKGGTPSTTVKLEILFDQLTGQVMVNGPINNAILCYGMLESAKDAIQTFNAEAAKNNRIQPVSVMPRIA